LKKIKTAIFISRRGSNMRALIAASKSDNYPADIHLVISNNKDAEGLRIAQENNIKTIHTNKNQFEELINSLLDEKKIELICLAGFMQILSNEFINKWIGRIINIHPSYLPAFKGLNAQAQAINSHATYSGCTVHFVNEKIDGGEIIMQKKVIINENEDIESLSKKILIQEHIIYPKALEFVANKILKNRN
tara:strand:+ start:247 stop:819 length:573 start_codon:yes stop_codon:yes gene_type:complete